MFLEVENLQAGYGTEEVLHGVSLRVRRRRNREYPLVRMAPEKPRPLLTISGLVRASGGAGRFRERICNPAEP